MKLAPQTGLYVRRALAWSVWIALGAAGSGCAPSTISPPPVTILEQDKPYLYSDADWAEVLQERVHDGMVDYAGLAEHPEPLKRYYALLSRTGPTLSPEQFSSSPQVVAYWINVYNALALLTVLQQYPVKTIYDLSLPSFDYGYRYVVDGRAYTLSGIERKMLEESQTDVRTLFATSRAAKGTPRLANGPYRASTLERQLQEAAANALDDPNILRVDHTSQTIQVWQGIFEHQEDFVTYWRMRRRVATAFVYNTLLDISSPTQRHALQTAVGYPIRQSTFDRTLNEWNPPTTATSPQ